MRKIFMVFFLPAAFVVAAEPKGPTPTPTVTLPDLYAAQVKGKVELFRKQVNGKVKKFKLKAPEALHEGDVLKVSSEGNVWLQFREGGNLELGPGGEAEIQHAKLAPKNFQARFSLLKGRLRNWLQRVGEAEWNFEIEAGGVVTGVRGTSFEVEYDPKKEEVQARTYEGKVEAQAEGKKVLLEKDKSLVYNRKIGFSLGGISAQDFEDFAHFLDFSRSLEEKKEIIQRQLQKRLLEKLTKELLGKEEDGRRSIRFGF